MRLLNPGDTVLCFSRREYYKYYRCSHSFIKSFFHNIGFRWKTIPFNYHGMILGYNKNGTVKVYFEEAIVVCDLEEEVLKLVEVCK